MDSPSWNPKKAPSFRQICGENHGVFVYLNRGLVPPTPTWLAYLRHTQSVPYMMFMLEVCYPVLVAKDFPSCLTGGSMFFGRQAFFSPAMYMYNIFIPMESFNSTPESFLDVLFCREMAVTFIYARKA